MRKQSSSRLLIYGILTGIVGFIPGLSVGTMMVVLGLYQQTIHSVSALRREPRESLHFLLPFVAGCALGVFGFSRFITFALSVSPMVTQCFFIGLLLGTLPMLYLRANAGGGWRWSHVLAFVLSAIVMLVTAVVMPGAGDVVHTLDLAGAVRMALAGFLAAVSMIIPGISGSFILMAFQCYATALWAVSTLTMEILLPLGVGSLLGVLVGAKVIERIMLRFPTLTYAAIFGLVLGSVFTMYPGLTLSLEGVAALVALAVGTRLALWFSSPDRAEIRQRRPGPPEDGGDLDG